MADKQTEKLLRLKEEIEQAKLEKAQVEGARDQNLQRLQEKFGVSTLDKAKKKLKTLKDKEEELQDEIDKSVADLEEKYGEL